MYLSCHLVAEGPCSASRHHVPESSVAQSGEGLENGGTWQQKPEYVTQTA
jgi:hypothetical protein